MRLSTVALASSLSSLAAAENPYHYYGNAELTLMGCHGSIFATATYCKSDSATKYKCTCSSEPALGSLLYCIHDKFKNDTKSLNEAQDWLVEYCKEVNATKITHEKLEKSYANVTNYLVDTTTVEGYNSSKIINYPVYYNKKKFVNYYNSYKVRYRTLTDSLYMGGGLLGYWALIFLFAIVYNFLNRALFINKLFTSPFFNSVRKHLVLPSLFRNKKHSAPFQSLKVFGGYIPLRIEFLVLFGYFVLFFVFSGVRYHFVQNNTIWKNHQAQISRYPGDRSGILCVYSFQLTFLFAGRNNLLIWLTGWKQSTFLAYHKWVSRMNFAMLLIHAGSFHVQSITLGKFHSRMLTYWYRWGIVATVAAGIMFVTSFNYLRKASYEVFLLIHIIMAVFFVVGSWYHLKKQEYLEFVYSIIAIWCFDRAVRLCRLFAFGVQKARVSVMNDEVLRLVIPKRAYWKPFPGAYGFVHFLRPLTFFQSHPFTIIETTETEIVFFSKIKGGITSDIHRYLSSFPDQTAEINISVEGPYGVPAQLNRYKSLSLISGGTGISGPFTHALNSFKSSVEQHVKLYWIIKDIKSLEWFRPQFERLRGSSVQITVFVTRSPEPSDSEGEKKSDSDPRDTESEKDDDFIQIVYGRPEIQSLVQNDIKEANGDIAFVTAAHNSIVDDVRYAIGENLNETKYRVDLLEEVQAW